MEEEDEDDSFFIIREICIWSFKNSVNPAVGTWGGEKKKIREKFFHEVSFKTLMSSLSLVTNLWLPSHCALRRSNTVFYGGDARWPPAIKANS